MKSLFKTLQWISIILLIITTFRLLVISSQFAHKKSNMLSPFGPTSVEFSNYDIGDLVTDSIWTGWLMIFTGYNFYLIQRKTRDFNSFKEDYLFYKPKWMVNSNLGFRRLFSIFTFLLLFGGFISIFITPLAFIFDFPGYLTNREDGFFNISLSMQVLSILIFWVSYGLIGIIHWIASGFKK